LVHAADRRSGSFRRVHPRALRLRDARPPDGAGGAAARVLGDGAHGVVDDLPREPAFQGALAREVLRARMPPPVEVLPRDVYNADLIAQVHPPDWRPPAPAPRYNLVVIGAGTAGLVTAAGAAGLGARVALVERELMGGDCLNVGCVPSKALLRAARAAAQVRKAGDFGVRVPDGVHVDFAAVMERM